MTPVEQITSLYVGYFGRAPEPAGLNYWVGRLADGFSLAEIAESFSVQAESTTKYPFLANQEIASPQAFITQVYMNLFNRVPDAAGLAYWTAELANGADVGDFILDVISGAQGADKTIIDNKIIVGADFALSTANQPGFVYNAAAAGAAVEVINGVDATPASVAAGKAETATFISSGIVGTATPFTTGIDTLQGTSGNDSFIGSVSNAAPTSSTINLGDSVNGGAGNDTLRIATDTNAIIPTLTSIERLEIVDNVHDSRDVSGIVGLTSFELEGGTTAVAGGSDIVVTVAAGQTLSLDGVKDGSANVDVATQGGIVVDSAASVTAVGLSLNNAGAANAAGAVNSDLDLNVTGAGVATLNINSTGANFVSLATAAALKTVNISGAGTTTIVGDVAATVTAVNASTATGSVSVSFGGGDVTATGGSGDDSFAFAATLTTADTIVGGAGSDTISISGADIRVPVANGVLPALNTKVSGVETLAFTGAAAALISGQTFTNTEITKLLFNTADVVVADQIDFAGSARTYAFGVDNTGAATLNGTAGVTTFNIGLEGSATNGADVGVLTANFTNNTATQVGTGSINISSTGANGTVNTITSIDGNSNVGVPAADLTSTKVTITGSHDLTIGGVTSASTIDASAFTGKLVVTGSAGQDFITGGTGADTFNITAGGDTYTGGAGNDVFDFDLASEASRATLTTIADFVSGADKIDLAGLSVGAGTFTATAVNVSAAPDFQGALNLAAAGDGSVNGVSSYFQYQGNTYIVTDNSAGATFVDGTDGVIKLAGLVNLAAADLVA